MSDKETIVPEQKQPDQKKLRIIYAGTPDFAVVPLAALIRCSSSYIEIIGVLTQPDRPSGRGKQLQQSPVKKFALSQGIDVLEPSKIKNNAALIEQLTKLKPDLIIVTAYGLILPEDLLNLASHGCINIHASLLPAWRGAAPIQRAVLAGDKVTGISIIQMDKGLDTGDILLTRTCTINPEDTAATLHDKLAELGAQAIVETLDKLVKEQLKPIKQNSQHATYAQKIHTEEAKINWSQSAKTIEKMIRAFNPKPVAYTFLANQRIKIWQAQAIAEDKHALPGTIISTSKSPTNPKFDNHNKADKQPNQTLMHQLIVQCGQGALSIEFIQLPGKKPMPVDAVIRGHQKLFQQHNQFE